MEVIGTVASLVTLAKEAATITDSLVRHFRQAPKELKQLQDQITLILSELTYIEQFEQQDALDALLPAEQINLLTDALQIAKKEMIATHEELEKYAKPIVGKPSVSSRLSWALFDRKSVEGAFEQLQRVESRLLFLLQLMNMRMSINSLKDNENLARRILDRLPTQPGSKAFSHNPNVSERPTQYVDIEPILTFRHQSTFVLSDYWKRMLGSDIELTTSSNTFQSAYEIYTRLPLPSIRGRMAFMLSLSIRRLWGYWPNISILGGSLNFVNLIPVDSEIVAACQRGDIVAVRTLFMEKKAAPNDLTTEDCTLIYYAIESGSEKLIRFLIDAGAPLQSKQLLRTAWRRQPDTARLLLRTKRVDVEALYRDGRPVPSFLFGPSRMRKPQTEYIEILANHSFSQFNSQDGKGWTVLHYAAAWGTAADIKVLKQVGAIQSLRTFRLSWTPLMCAVGNRNLDTLQALLDLSDDVTIREDRDLRGWNLLHVAVGYNNFEAVPYLLDKGADLNATSIATSFHVPPLLKEKRVRPGDIARAFGERAYRKWVETLELSGHAVDTRPQDIDWDVEKAYELFGECECCDNWKS